MWPDTKSGEVIAGHERSGHEPSLALNLDADPMIEVGRQGLETGDAALEPLVAGLRRAAEF
jgi:hypothetical protein